MSEFIMNKDKDDKSYTLASDANGDIVYTMSGKHGQKTGEYYVMDISVEDAKTSAHAHAIKSNNKLLVKVGENGRLFNPYGLFSEGMENKQKVGRPTWKFRTTTRSVFNNYVRFLATRNETFLRTAEREMI